MTSAEAEIQIGAKPRRLSRDEARQLLRHANGRYYVYLLVKPCGTPFYVGKGIGDRVFHHESIAANTSLKSHKLNTLRALQSAGIGLGYDIELMSSEAEALARERQPVQLYGRHCLGTGCLTNMTDGGEGPANFSEETRQRHRDTLAGVLEDGSARSATNAFFQRIGIKVDSVPIKPLSEQRLEALTPHPSPRRPTERQAAALAALAIGCKKILEPDCELARRFDLEGEVVALENGAGRDMLKSGMIELVDSKGEILRVTALGFAATVRFVGKPVLIDYGVLMPSI
jgi:hypothetical protein